MYFLFQNSFNVIIDYEILSKEKKFDLSLFGKSYLCDGCGVRLDLFGPFFG